MYAYILVKIQQQIISKVDGVFIFYCIVFIDTLVPYVSSLGLESLGMQCQCNRIGGIMVRMLALSVVDHGFETQSGQTKDYKIVFCCFSTKHAALSIKSKDWLAQNQDNVSEWSDMSTRGLLLV